jgi:glycogen(starch) synthase
VITTDHPGCREVVGDAALTVAAGDAAALRHRLALLLADPEQVAALGDAGRSRAAGFSSEMVAGRFAALFEHCLRPAAGRQVPASRRPAAGRLPG